MTHDTLAHETGTSHQWDISFLFVIVKKGPMLFRFWPLCLHTSCVPTLQTKNKEPFPLAHYCTRVCVVCVCADNILVQTGPMHPITTAPNDASPRYPNRSAASIQHQHSDVATTTLPNVSEDDKNLPQQYSLTLELTALRSGSSNESIDVGPIRKVESNDGSIRLIATMPSSTVDGEQINLTAALLFEQIDQLAVSESKPYRVERVKIYALKFTNAAIIGIHGFLSQFTETIKHVSLKDIVAQNFTPMEERAFVDLCNVFQSCTLETLNLSDNTISASVWKCWSNQSHLRQLILDFVEIPDVSLCEMAQHFSFGDTLEELYVVLTNHIGPTGVLAANNVLKECRYVASLRWAVKDAPPDALMPWRGLANLAQEMTKQSKQSTLLHLVMDGGTIAEEDCGAMGIGGALEYFTQLKSIKFRSIGLKDIGALQIAKALSVSRPPLETLDLSRNFIQSSGASSIAALSGVLNIATNLRFLSLERNSIDADGAINALSAFGIKGNKQLDFRLDGNPFSFSKVAYTLACQNAQLENDSLHETKDALELEVIRLQEEKAVLMLAFSIMGSSNHVVECARMVDRISTLERELFGQSQGTDANKYRTDDLDSSLRHRTKFSDHSSRAEHPLTPIGSTSRAITNANQLQKMNHTNILRSPIPSHSKSKNSNTINTMNGNEYWSASPAGSCYSTNSNQKKKVGISGSISETPNMYQASPGLSGFIKNSSTSSGGSQQLEYDDATKSGRTTSSSGSKTKTTRHPSPFTRR